MTRRTSRHVPFLARFFSGIQFGAPDECWPWIGAAGPDGYGRIKRGYREYRTHRVAWEMANNREPDGFVCHACDNPPCCNPAHLWLGTPLDNSRDMVAKGRSTRHRRMPRNGGAISRSKTHCAYGHQLTPENSYRRIKSNGSGSYIFVSCRRCNADAQARRKARGLAKALPTDLAQEPSV